MILPTSLGLKIDEDVDACHAGHLEHVSHNQIKKSLGFPQNRDLLGPRHFDQRGLRQDAKFLLAASTHTNEFMPSGLAHTEKQASPYHKLKSVLFFAADVCYGISIGMY